VVVEHDSRAPKAGTLSTLTAAGQLGVPVSLLVAGKGVGQVAEAASKFSGVHEVSQEIKRS
jgi:electron transfer flavoprotein alpha subunit